MEHRETSTATSQRRVRRMNVVKCGTADRSWQSQLRERPTLYQALLSLPRYATVYVFFVLGIFVAVKVEQPFFFGVDESYGHDGPVDERKAQHTYVVPQ